MAEYVVKGAEKNETVLHSRTPNGYEAWRWLPVLERIVRCRDCDFSRENGTLCILFAGWEPIASGDEYELVDAEVEPDGFCKWGVRRESE